MCRLVRKTSGARDGCAFPCTCNGEEGPSVFEQEAEARGLFLEQLRRRGSTEGES